QAVNVCVSAFVEEDGIVELGMSRHDARAIDDGVKGKSSHRAIFSINLSRASRRMRADSQQITGHEEKPDQEKRKYTRTFYHVKPPFLLKRFLLVRPLGRLLYHWESPRGSRL